MLPQSDYVAVRSSWRKVLLPAHILNDLMSSADLTGALHHLHGTVSEPLLQQHIK
jgi:hypothetical protein